MKQPLKKIVCKIPRENSGSVSSNRFDYQKDWTICKLLDLSTTKNDFLLLCDYHEDVTILNKENNPKKISFYQIKTDKKNNWTVNRLLKRKKGTKGDQLPSILGKLCKHCIDYKECLDGLFFISNANFSIELLDGKISIGKVKINFKELSDNEKDKITKALKTEFSVGKYISFDKNLCFEITDLSLNDHSNHTKGKLLDYLENINPDKSYPITAIYKTLFGEVKRRTNYEFPLDDYEILKRKKGISKTFFDKILGGVTDSIDPKEIFRELTERIRQENVDFRTSIKIQSYCKKYEVERMDATNEYLYKLKSYIQDMCKEYIDGRDRISLIKLAEIIHKKLKEKKITENFERITAIMFWVIYEELSI